MIWHCVEISDPDYLEIKKIKDTLGYASVNSFVQEAVKAYLETKRWQYERKLADKEDAIIEEHEKGEPSIGFDK